MSKSQSFRDRRTREGMVNGQVSSVHQGFRTLPHKSKLRKPSVRCAAPAPRGGILGQGERVCPEGNSIHTVGSHRRVRTGPFREPELGAESGIRVERFQSCLLPPSLHRRLDSGLLLHTKAVLLVTPAADLARHLTSADLRVWRVKGGEGEEEEDLGLGVTSGIELCTLPQGEQLREDVIERSECQRLWVMTSVLTCTAVRERAEMVKVWVEVGRELESGLGNLYSMASLMEALTSPQVQRLTTTWRTLRQHHTPSAFTFDTRLKPLFQSLRLRGTPSPPPTRPLTLPYLTPTLRLLQESKEEEDRGSHVHRLMTSWHPSDLQSSLDVVLHHLHHARSMAGQTELLTSSARQVLADIQNVVPAPGVPGLSREGKGTSRSGEENVQQEDSELQRVEEKHQENAEELNMSYIYSKLQSFRDDGMGKDLRKTWTENQENLNALNTPTVRLQHVDKLGDLHQNAAEDQSFSSTHGDVSNVEDQMEDFGDNGENCSDNGKSSLEFADNGRNSSDDCRNSSNNGRNSSNNGKNSSDDGKNSSEFADNGKNSSDFADNGKNSSDFADNGKNSSDNGKNSSEFADTSSEERRAEEGGRSDVEDMVRTEFQLKLLWGPQATLAGRPQRVHNLEHLLTVLSERLEPPPNSGTAL